MKILKNIGKIVLPSFFLFTIFSPTTTYASVISLITSVLNLPDSEIKQINTEYNSQNMEILVASTNVDHKESVGGGGITIVDEMALASETGVVGTTLDIEKAENVGRISRYVVREGDTLSQIAEMFEVSSNTIRWANDLSGSIQPGDELVILPVSGITHTVKSGGTIEDIANIYEADVREIALFNGLSTDEYLEPGVEVLVPNVHPEGDHDHSHEEVIPTGMTQVVKSSTLINPVPGGIITQAIHGYNGVDIATNGKTPILAAASGEVIRSKQGGWNGGYGNYVVIDHNNGVQTLYAHNTSNIVYVGEYVEQGQVIGYMGSTGRSTGQHLHFEVRGGYNILSDCAVGSVCR